MLYIEGPAPVKNWIDVRLLKKKELQSTHVLINTPGYRKKP